MVGYQAEQETWRASADTGPLQPRDARVSQHATRLDRKHIKKLEREFQINPSLTFRLG